MRRSRVLMAVVAFAALVSSEPAAAFRGRTHAGGTFAGRSVGYTPAWRERPAFGGGWGNPDYGYGYHCRNYGYGYNCPYYELPDWNGTTEIKNPGG